MKKLVLHTFCAVVFLSLAAVPAFPQADVATATLKGTVTDESNAVIPGAGVTVKDLDRGLTREATTDTLGVYQVRLLPPGAYEVRISAAGFITRVMTRVELTVGQIAVYDAHLRVGAVSQEVIVSAEAPLVETERTQQANTIQQAQIANLPNIGRDFTSYVFTLPGVSSSNAPRIQHAGFTFGTSGFSIGGSNGRSNLITMDGGENEYGSGQLRVATLSPEAVQEFQVNRNAFAAEFGQTAGTAVNVVTKSGTNDFHGSGYVFYRSQNTSARYFFDNNARKAFDQRIYPGLTFGGPFLKNKLFYFTSYEALKSDAARFRSYTTSSLLQPNAAQLAYAAGLPSSVGDRLRAALTTANYPTTMKLLKQDEGTFHNPARLHTWSSRIDYQIGDKDSFSARFSLSDGDSDQIGVGQGGAPSNATDLFTRDYTLLGTWIRNIAPNVINQARMQFASNSARTQCKVPGSTEMIISGLASFGCTYTAPFNTFQDRYQFEDILSWVHGRHTLKFGASYRPVSYHVINALWFGGQWTFSPGIYPVSLALPAADRAGLPPAPATTLLTGVQAFNLGLPYLYRQGFNNPEWRGWTHFLGTFAQDSWKATPRLTVDYGLRFDYDGEPTPLRHYANVSPRLGFAWDPRGDQKTVFRAAAGLFYSPVYYQVSYLTNTLNDSGKYINQIFKTPLTVPQTPPVIWGYGLSQNKLPFVALNEKDLNSIGVPTGPKSSGRVIFDADPNYKNPYSFQGSFGVARHLVSDLSLEVAYQYYRTVHVQTSHEVNYRESGVDAGFGLGPRLVAIDPTITQSNLYSSIGNATYHGMTASLSKRFSHNSQFQINYTFSKAMDDVVDFNSAFSAFLPTRLNLDRSVSVFDVRHNFVASGVFRSPWKAGKGHHPLARAFADITLSPIVSLRSGIPFSILMGADTNGDTHGVYDRPFYAPRNSASGANFYNADIRLNKEFFVSREKGWRVEFIVEATNLFNHTNFISVQNNLSALSPANVFGTDRSKYLLGPFNLHGDRSLAQTSFLGFNSAADARRIQFGLKIAF